MSWLKDYKRVTNRCWLWNTLIWT